MMPVLLLVGACAGADAAPLDDEAGAGGGDVAGLAGREDRDGDGLCDVSEEVAGTDRDAPNTDRDRLPDLFEVAYDFNAANPDIPAADQVGYLDARPGASLDFTVRATVDGDGQGHTGQFRAQTPIYGGTVGADTFFTGSVAVSADPTDNVRGLEADASRFGSVLGSTRLSFRLRFQVPTDIELDEDCARAYPFRYELKGDDGESRARRQYLLVVAPDGASGPEGPWCPLPACY